MRRVALASPPLFSMLLAAGAAFAAPPHTVTLPVENMTCGTTEAGYPSKLIDTP
jgi:hypothetical protein